jgi:hypothetical protein
MNVKPPNFVLDPNYNKSVYKSLWNDLEVVVPIFSGKAPYAHIIKQKRRVEFTLRSGTGGIAVKENGPAYEVQASTGLFDATLSSYADVDKLIPWNANGPFTLLSHNFIQATTDAVCCIGTKAANHVTVASATSTPVRPMAVIVHNGSAILSPVAPNKYAYQSNKAKTTAHEITEQNLRKLYVDGQYIGQSSTAFDLSVAGSQTDLIMTLGGDVYVTSNASTTPSYVSVAYLWSRTLTPEEHLLIAKDPFGPLRRNERIIGSAPKTVYAGSGRPGA